MWKSALVLIITINCYASSKSLLASANNLFINKITSTDLIEVSKNAKKQLVNNKSDKDYFIAYDLVKTLDISIALDSYTPERCTKAKFDLFTMYGVKDTSKLSEQLPKGAFLGYKILEKTCKDNRKIVPKK